MAAAINAMVSGMTQQQFAKLAVHEKLQHSTKLPNHFLMNHAPLSRGHTALTLNNATHVFQPTYARIVQPRLKAKRPLNSWMAYRAFYKSIFTPLQQKDASIHLTAVWQEDPFKAKWTIIARAYSVIRDQVGKPSAPLDRFFTLVCPEIGILDTTEYLNVMGWAIQHNADGSMTLTQVFSPDIASLDNHIQHTMMTEKDVVHYCGQHGYIDASVAATIVGPTYDPAGSTAAAAAAQQTLLAIAPVVNSAPRQLQLSPRDALLAAAANNPIAAISDAIGCNLSLLYGKETPPPPNVSPDAAPYQWTGCMADLYAPDEGTYNFARLTDDRVTSSFVAGDISDPRSFDVMFGAVIENGFQHRPVFDAPYDPRAGL